MFFRYIVWMVNIQLHKVSKAHQACSQVLWFSSSSTANSREPITCTHQRWMLTNSRCQWMLLDSCSHKWIVTCHTTKACMNARSRRRQNLFCAMGSNLLAAKFVLTCPIWTFALGYSQDSLPWLCCTVLNGSVTKLIRTYLFRWYPHKHLDSALLQMP